MKKRNLIWTTIIAVIGTIGLILILKNLPEDQKSAVSVISIIGTYASVFGLIIACIQIFSLKRISEATKIEVLLTQKRLSQVISVSELSKANKIIQEIQHFISTDKHELGLLRMKDLKEIIIHYKCSSDLYGLTKTAEYNEIIQKLSDDLKNLSDFVMKSKKANFSIMNQNLETISTTILNYESKIKNNSYDK